MKISKLKSELDKADESLKDTTSFYEKNKALQTDFQNKIAEIKQTKDILEEKIFENKARITQMNNFNNEVLNILKKLDDDVKTYVREVASLREDICKEKMDFLKEIQDLKTKNLKADQNHKQEIYKRDKDLMKINEELAKEKQQKKELRIQLETLERNLNLSKVNEKSNEQKVSTQLSKVSSSKPQNFKEPLNIVNQIKDTPEDQKSKPETQNKNNLRTNIDQIAPEIKNNERSC